ncbi:hypothetical protein AU05_14860 [Ectopseudomonas composti]|uniref:Uncharacterized protein n=1 Tax=Ectopseudomonas composti TaxID=658457 RepID=A0ABN0SBI8_9GAMM|nr:hypothetical protein AU05_14860 [Pseudomonas composti]
MALNVLAPLARSSAQPIPLSELCYAGLETLTFPLDEPVALATQLLQLMPIEYGNGLGVVIDYPLAPELIGSAYHVRATRTGPVSKQLLRHRRTVTRQMIKPEQEQATELLIDRMMPGTNGGLRHLRDQGLRITQHESQQISVTVELILEQRTLEAKGMAAALNHGTAREILSANRQGDTHHPVISNDRNLRHGAVLCLIEQRDEGIDREIDVTHHIMSLMENLA